MDNQGSRFSQWVGENWSRAGLMMAIMLLLIAPLIGRSGNRVLLAVYLWLPFYMLHQYEEHGQGTLLEFYRRTMPRVAPMLTERKLLLVNLGAVWLVCLLSTYAAVYGLFWLALYAPYLSLVNALMHVGQLVARRSYNPGLWTAVVIFLRERLTRFMSSTPPEPLKPTASSVSRSASWLTCSFSRLDAVGLLQGSE